MATTMQVNIVSAEGEIFSGTADMVVAPAKLGEVGVALGHTPMITQLNPGEVRVQAEGQEEQHIFVSGGRLEVQPKVLTVLADTAIRASDLDEATRKQLERGERVMELMKQPQYQPMSVAEMALSLFAANEGYIDDVAGVDVTFVSCKRI